MVKKGLWWCLVIVGVFVMTALAVAQPPPSKAERARHADKNKDGVVDSVEIAQWKERRTAWKAGRAKVNTAVEQKYDRNGDGWLEPAEAREMLKDKHVLVSTEGRAKVNTAVEAEYDRNKDGVIDAKEAAAMKEDAE